MSLEFETPSKPLANTLSTIGLSSPETKVSSANLASKLAAAAAKEDSKAVDKKQSTAAEDDEEAKAAVALAEVKAQPLEEYRTRFVGEVDLPESEEPLLKETKSRFVLFPIKYREVSRRRSCQVVLLLTFRSCRSGKCTRRPRHRSGLLKRSISPWMCTTGRTR